MQRRDFIKVSSIGTSALAFSSPVWGSMQNPGMNDNFKTKPVWWKIHQNGAFDIHCGDVSITECYPSLNTKPILPIAVEISDTQNNVVILYRLNNDKEINVRLLKNEHGIQINSKLKGFTKLPHYFYPLSLGTIQGANRFFKQGMGFSGASGIYHFPDPKSKIENATLKEDVWSYDSYLTSGFLATDDTTLVMAAYNHSDFLQRSTFYNRQHRFGLIDRHLNENSLRFEAGFATEKIYTQGNEITLPALHFTAGNNPFGTFRKMAQNIADYNKVKLNKKPRYHYCSWYDKGHDFSLDDLSSLLSGLQEIEPPVDIQTIQIDAGYCYLGDWLKANEKWPGGMENAFKKIKKAGYTPGIWVGPFMVNSNSFIYKKHPDWLLRDRKGEIIVEWEKDYHSGGKVCVLDTSHPEAFEYLRKTFRTFRKWGVRYFKTDFMDWGLRDSTKVKRYQPGKTSSRYFTEVVKMIRQEIGNDSFWLGCISPYQPMVGYVDGMRVSNDVHDEWNKGSTINMFNETFAGQYFNNVLWQNDPDVLYLRDYNNQLNEDEMYSIALWDGILGCVVNTSDRFSKLTKERLKWWRFLKPAPEKQTAKLPFWGELPQKYVAVLPYPDLKAWAIVVVNTNDSTQKFNLSLQKLINHDSAYVFEWQPGKSSSLGKSQQVKAVLQKHESRLYYVSLENKKPDSDLALSGIKINGLD